MQQNGTAPRIIPASILSILSSACCYFQSHDFRECSPSFKDIDLKAALTLHFHILFCDGNIKILVIQICLPVVMIEMPLSRLYSGRKDPGKEKRPYPTKSDTFIITNVEILQCMGLGLNVPSSTPDRCKDETCAFDTIFLSANQIQLPSLLIWHFSFCRLEEVPSIYSLVEHSVFGI